jgi:hypothetical protein
MYIYIYIGLLSITGGRHKGFNFDPANVEGLIFGGVYICIYIYVCMCVYVYVNIYVYMYVCMSRYVYLYIYMYKGFNFDPAN